MQVHHGGAGTTATGLRAGVMYFSSRVLLMFLIVSEFGINLNVSISLIYLLSLDFFLMTLME